MKVKVFTTGGTIDGLEYSKEEDAPKSKKSLIPFVLQSLNITDYSIEHLMDKDSRFITNDDRRKISNKCRDCSEKYILITHGTITMVKTALYLKKDVLNKVVVITGAMIPADQENTDAPHNIKLAIASLGTLPAGVYISMSGRIFDADNVRKNVEKGIFETLK